MLFPSTLHLGFAKCGSTFLQAFWRHHPAVNMVFKAEFFAPLGSSSFEKGPNHYAASFTRSMPHQHVIESDEHMLMGIFHPVLGVHSVTPASVEETCRRIKSVVPNVKLLLVVRNQLEMMVSTYSQYLLGGGVLTLDQFAEEFLRCSTNGRNYFCFYFDEIIETVEHYFPGRLKVILAEELARDTDAQLHEICDYMGIPFVEFHSTFRDRRVGLSRVGMPLVRTLNRMVVRRHAPRFMPDLWLPYSNYKFICNVARVVEHYALRHWTSPNRYQLASPQLIASMRERFAESNKRFGLMLGKDLSRWSYSLPEVHPSRPTSEHFARKLESMPQHVAMH